jgi:hypothetical protein
MANPTGTTYLTANPSYVWADGDVYEIPQTDELEGAATGASFGGLGVENQPHLFLLNKINYLKQNLVQATSDVGVNGWYRLTSQDANLGRINIIEQWGIIPANKVPTISSANQSQIPFSFPLAFTTACWVILPYIAFTTAAESGNFLEQNAAILPVAPFNVLNNTLLLGWQSTQQAFNQNVYGIGWRALGY